MIRPVTDSGSPDALERTLLNAGRIVLASLFVLGGIAKIASPDLYLDRMTAAGLEPARLLLTLVIALELCGGLWVSSGARGHGLPALALAAHTLLINVTLYPFWEVGDPDRVEQISFFFKNVSIAGGLLFVAGVSRRHDRERLAGVRPPAPGHDRPPPPH